MHSWCHIVWTDLVCLSLATVSLMMVRRGALIRLLYIPGPTTTLIVTRGIALPEPWFTILDNIYVSPWRRLCRTQSSVRMLEPRLLAFAVFSLAALWPQLVAGRQAFTINEVATQNRRPFSGAELMRDACLKYGRKVPEAVQRAIRLNVVPPGRASVKTVPLFEDMEYVMPVDVGGQVLSLQLDTGSSDLYVASYLAIRADIDSWVFSTLQPAEQRSSRKPHKLYDPLRSGARRMNGHTWVISYDDLSGAYGEVYVDRVTIENLTVLTQAVGVATSVSRTFLQDGEVDGLLGLGFTELNSITPNPQKTWFDNIRGNLSAPLFATALRRRRAGAYDFGYIDSEKYVGNITWTDVDGEDGFWDFGVSGFAVGGESVSKTTIRADADTGTSSGTCRSPSPTRTGRKFQPRSITSCKLAGYFAAPRSCRT